MAKTKEVVGCKIKLKKYITEKNLVYLLIFVLEKPARLGGEIKWIKKEIFIQCYGLYG